MTNAHTEHKSTCAIIAKPITITLFKNKGHKAHFCNPPALRINIGGHLKIIFEAFQIQQVIYLISRVYKRTGGLVFFGKQGGNRLSELIV